MSLLMHCTRMSTMLGPFSVILAENPPQNKHASHVCFAFFQGHKLLELSARHSDYKFNGHTLEALSNEIVGCQNQSSKTSLWYFHFLSGTY